MKIEFKDFVLELLQNLECKGIHDEGPQIRCQCPFHRSKRNFTVFSINVEDEMGLYRCFSCGESGSIYKLLMFVYGCDYEKAEKILFRRVAVAPITVERLRKLMSERTIGHSFIESAPTIELPPKFSSKPMIKYLKYRNRMEQHNIMNIDYIVKLYQLYYCDTGRYAKRIIMPIRDHIGRYVFMTNRSIYHDDKRKNIFPKGADALNFLYGLYESLDKEKVMVVEGPFEIFQLKSFALKNKIKDWGFVAMMGGEISEERAGLLSTFFKEAYLLFDNQDDVWKRDKKPPFFNKEDKAYNILSDFMPTYRITRRLYEGKEAATSTEEQLWKLFKFKPKKSIKIAGMVF